MDDAQLADMSRELREQINANTLDDVTEDGNRWHLGISIIGQECHRATWYDFRWFSKPQNPAHVVRLFARGHREEPMIVGMLRRNGLAVDTHNADGKQFMASSVNGHYGGSCDGMLTSGQYGTLLLEMKTHNTGSFSRVVAQGVKEAKPQHYAQMCGYGYGFKLDYGLYFAVNKNDDDIWCEFVRLDYELGKQLELRAESIIIAREPPAKISRKATDYRCKMCKHQDVCHHGVVPERHCRSCVHSMPTNDGEWWCGQYSAVIPRDVVRTGCDTYKGIQPT